MAQAKHPSNQIWAVYNHLPGGNLVAIHFEDFYRKKQQDGKTEEVLISSKAQLEGFKKGAQVALNMNGSIVARELLVYDGPSLEGKFDAADTVLAWAVARGARPIRSEVEQRKIDEAQGSLARVVKLEGEIAGIKGDVASIREDLGKVLAAIKAPAAPVTDVV